MKLLLALSLAAVPASATCPEGMRLVPGRAETAVSADPSPDPFCLDVTEVPVHDYLECAERGACSEPWSTVAGPDIPPDDVPLWSLSCNGPRLERSEHPVNCIAWTQAEAYCAAVGKRLPTEAEWEWAASGGEERRRYPWGGQRPSPQRLNVCGYECTERLKRLGRPRRPLHFGDDGFEDTAPVGSFPDGAGRWGHLDLAGNVWEFTATPWGEEERVRVIRGGGWAQTESRMTRTGFRAGYLTTARGSAVGFRCAAGPTAP